MYRPDIDGLRALAIALVIFFHIWPDIFKGGFVGVDIFFVISGFLITKIVHHGLENNNFSFAEFYIRRIKRILPVLIIVTILSFIFGWFLLLPREFRELGKHIAGGMGFVANFTLWSDSGYFDVLPELKPLLNLWSLGVEEQFYLLWPLTLYLIYKTSPPKKYYRFSCLFIVTAILISFLANIILIKNNPELVFFFPFTRFWEIFTGGLICIISKKHYEKVISTQRRNLFSILGLILLTIATFAINKYSLFPGWLAIIPVLGTTFIIIAGEHSWLNKKLFSNKYIVNIGLISYPLYLWHWPILSFITINGGLVSSAVDKFIILASSLTLAWLSFCFIETPIRKGKNKIIFFILIISSLMMLLLGSAIFILNGLPGRISKNTDEKLMPVGIQEMLNPDFGGDISISWRSHDCFLNKGESKEDFKKECDDYKYKPSLFLWGDSHAATLYAGLKSYQNKINFSITQRTSSACPPIVNWIGGINKLCKDINDYNLASIKIKKPDIVILEAAWYWTEYDWKRIEDTIDELQKIKIQKIILIGPVPLWKDKVSNLIISYYRDNKIVPSTYTNYGLDTKEGIRIDNDLEKIAKRKNITYISILKTLCSQKGCMLSIGKDIKNISSLDQGHLSESASIFFIESNSKEIFGQH
ncbi:acyltransferase family protein [Candidatus Methylopumilus planktonicus]|uniref:acyltransferase family protein n=1 Tax=Candidatus Methylopumilus planktonicus TaxID=1581557 RepID=UPI003D188F37